MCKPIHFDRSGHAASRDRAYVDEAYATVVNTMQAELDLLKREVGVGRPADGWFVNLVKEPEICARWLG